MSIKIKRVFAASVILFLFTSSMVSAYVLKPYGWPKQIGQTYTIKVKYNTSVENYKTAWSTAATDWNGKQSKLKIDLSDLNVSSSNLVGTMNSSDTSLYGQTTVTYSGSTISYFSAKLNTGNSSIVNNATVRRSVANHEFGHAMGLDDNNYTPQQDDVDGINEKYKL